MILDFFKKTKKKKDVSESFFILFAEYFSSECELMNINGERTGGEKLWTNLQGVPLLGQIRVWC